MNRTQLLDPAVGAAMSALSAAAERGLGDEERRPVGCGALRRLEPRAGEIAPAS
ncbi:hypothetical protein [Streptomyces sp. NPDC004629]|uniref:hypothetical protein n=1 Tax=Streptomyces sp. NPDC004629 TaxID=3364705 RepID=UPI0036A393B9